MRPVAPRGFRDVLPQEAGERKVVTDAALSTFRAWGYGLVETPAAEEYRTLEAGAGGSLEGTAFRFIDQDGTLLALRPEMTLPIARLAASRLADEPRPLRLCYAAPVFRERESLRGDARQFTQIGIELIGVNGALSDAEVVGVLVETLEATGLPEFVVGVGTVGVLFELLEVSGCTDEWRTAYMRAAHTRNLVEVDRLCADPALVAAAATALRRVPRISGGSEAVEECRRVAGAAGAGRALEPLAETWTMLERAGLTGRVRADFGILRSFDYYTGLVVEAYAPGLGLPLGGGGRYDGVLAGYGSPEPAAGFAVSLERLHIALIEQGAAPEAPSTDEVVSGDDPGEVFARAAALRASGRSVAIGAPQARGGAR